VTGGGLAGAIALLTRVPVARGLDRIEPARAVPWFPLVGAAIGATIAGVFVLLSQLLPVLLAAALAALCGAALTGAFHEDGLGDVMDAFASGWTAERRLEILDDPRLGTFGVLAVSGALIVRVGAIATFDEWTALAVLPVAHALSRAAAISLLRRLPFARPDGMGAGYARDVTRRAEAAAVGSAVVLAAVTIGLWAVPGALLCVASAAAVGAWARAKIGGMTGDVLGATQQVAELALLLMAAAAVHEGWGDLVWWTP
jgi:adenosylcobinamide-GDP ribazoletransferase